MGNLLRRREQTYDTEHKYREVEITYRLKQIIDRWKLTNDEVRYLHDRFCAIDKDNSGTIDSDEFFEHIEMKKSTFLDAMFTIIVGEQNQLDFAGWLTAVFAFCLTTRQEMIELVFESFDHNKDGYISLPELHHFLVVIHGDNTIFPKEIVHALTEQNLARNGLMDFDQFVAAEANFPMLLWPVFRLQHRVRKRTLGIEFFKRIDERIVETFFKDMHSAHLQKKWRARLEMLRLYCCSWPCCMENAENEPTLLVEVRARRRDMRRMHEQNALRKTAKSPEFEQLPMENSHHLPEDEVIERNIIQLSTKPLVERNLIEQPVTLVAINDDGEEYSLSSGSSQESLSEVEEEEYPDMAEEEQEMADRELRKLVEERMALMKAKRKQLQLE